MFSLHHGINPHKNVFFYLTARSETLESITSRLIIALITMHKQ